MDESPAYAKGKLARELREVLVSLEKAELSPANLGLLEGVRALSDRVDKHLDKVFASLDNVPVRELVATSQALERRKDSSRDFAGIFRNVADARDGGWSTSLARFHLGDAVSRANEGFVEQISEAEAPFWAHVRDALRA